jgi:hypothetical protein
MVHFSTAGFANFESSTATLCFISVDFRVQPTNGSTKGARIVNGSFTPLARLPDETVFEDYRDVDGVSVVAAMRRSSPVVASK